jgi:hypothetical protein
MSSPTLSHLNIIENEADYGGGIYFKSDPGSGFSAIPKIENVRILNNLSNYDGGGVYSGLNAILENVRILGNQASRYGGGIFCSYLELLHVEIIGNIADRGGGIYFANHSASVDSSIINRNYASTGGGIFCDYFTGPTINNSEINENSGGGIFCWEYTRLNLNNCKIIKNNGNGASCSGDGSGFSMNTVLISQNSGAGISLGYYGGVWLSNVTIKKNMGTGIYFGVNSSASFDPVNRSNIYHNQNGSGNGRELRSYQSEVISPNHINVIVDTFSVLIPTDQDATPLSHFSFNILHEAGPFLIEYDHYFINPNGDNSNSGFSPDQPRKNITYQLLTIPENNNRYIMIHLAEGIYSNSTNGETFPLSLRPKVTISGSSKESVIIDAEETSRVFRIDRDYISLRNMTITGGSTSEAGGGICQKEYRVVNLENLIITGNRADLGGGIYTDGGISYKNVDIFQNTARLGGGIFFDEHATAKFDSVNRCNIFSNEGEDRGIDLHAWGHRDSSIFKVYVDTFTVLNPDAKYVYPLHYFTMDIKHTTNDTSSQLPDLESIVLFPNYPNPFTSYTNIKFHLVATEKVNIDIYNIQGQHVKSLLKNGLLTSDEYTIKWYGENGLSQQVASGKVKFRKMIYLK